MKVITPALILIASLGIGSIAYASDPDQGTVCPAIYAPVCTSHQVQCIKAPCYPVYQTFGNSCEANANHATVIHEGECTATETGPIKPTTEAYTPPARCVAWFDGCNSCSKTANGVVCTMKACFAPAAGYCTQYEAEKPPVVTPPNPEVPPALSSTNTPVTATEPEQKPFWVSFWHWLTSFFSW